MEQTKALTQPAAIEGALSVQSVKDQIQLIQQIMKDAMQEGEHYGTIPGCGDKKALLKAGAEKLNLTFRLAPEFDIEVIEMGNFHREYRVKCTISSIVTGVTLGMGVGSCSTMESKYRYRKAEQKCPECGKEAIIKGKKEYGGGWLCFKKKDGCGAKFEDGDPRIENQEMGRVEYDNPADYYNTVLKMAKKRAMVDADLTVTAASDIFTQDLDEDEAAQKLAEEEAALSQGQKSAPKKTPPKKAQPKQPAAQEPAPAQTGDPQQEGAITPKSPQDAKDLQEMIRLFGLMELKEDRRKYYMGRARLLGPSAALDEVKHEYNKQNNLPM